MRPKFQRPWKDIRDELNAKLGQSHIDINFLKNKGNLDYWAARRLKETGVKNRTNVTDWLCYLLKIDIIDTSKSQSEGLQKLSRVIEKVWDGTQAHAELMEKLIRSTQPFQVKDRSESGPMGD